jgi:hypothetical protein
MPEFLRIKRGGVELVLTDASIAVSVRCANRKAAHVCRSASICEHMPVDNFANAKDIHSFVE